MITMSVGDDTMYVFSSCINANALASMHHDQYLIDIIW